MELDMAMTVMKKQICFLNTREPLSHLGYTCPLPLQLELGSQETDNNPVQ